MENKLLCSVCDYDYTHLIGMINVKDNDDYQATDFVVNQKYTISVKTNYQFRSQGNIHLLFRCEDGHFFVKSFDGHKGMVFLDENPLMYDLGNHLNKVYEKEDKLSLSLDYELLGNIEKFFTSKRID